MEARLSFSCRVISSKFSGNDRLCLRLARGAYSSKYLIERSWGPREGLRTIHRTVPTLTGLSGGYQYHAVSIRFMGYAHDCGA
eukprot:6197514-Pleurochrysis_carterae.AAC.5